MRTFKNCAAQGDVLITRINALPENIKQATPEANGEHIVAHSETGHHHVISSDDVNYYLAANDNVMDEFVAYLDVKKTTVLRHLRSFDTHEPIEIGKGVYRLNRQREYTLEGFRKALD